MNTERIFYSPYASLCIQTTEKMRKTRMNTLGALQRSVYGAEHYLKALPALGFSLITKLIPSFTKDFPRVPTIPDAFRSSEEELSFFAAHYFHLEYPVRTLTYLLAALPLGVALAIPTPAEGFTRAAFLAYITFSTLDDTEKVNRKTFGPWGRREN